MMPDKESPTGRGYTQGSDSYRADDVAQMEQEERRMGQLRRPLGCTCWDSDFGMDVDRCPIHGVGCT
jgi:hypothetical protein